MLFDRNRHGRGLARAHISWQLGLVGICALTLTSGTPRAATDDTVDIALVVSVDISESVDDARYRLQMEGIAEALEDPGVISTIISGPHGAIVLSMVTWADKSEIAVPWVRIASKTDALAVADRVRHLRRYTGEFTCMARMFRNLNDDLLASVPVKAARTVVDVSGDGIDNCSPDAETVAARDILVAKRITINGLPIIEDPTRIVGAGAYRAPGSPMGNLRPLETTDQLTLEEWYRRYVMGGETAFILPANGYEDFARAMRQKFVTEISSLPLDRGGADVRSRPPALLPPQPTTLSAHDPDYRPPT